MHPRLERRPEEGIGRANERMHGTGDDMASILEFRQPAFGSRQVTVKQVTVKSDAAASADIVLFPGVRYERWTEADEASAKPRRRARRRDHLDLDD